MITYSPSVLGNVNPSRSRFHHGTDIIAAGKKGLCEYATSTTDCTGPYVVTMTAVTFFVRTLTNSVMKGWLTADHDAPAHRPTTLEPRLTMPGRRFQDSRPGSSRQPASADGGGIAGPSGRHESPFRS